MPRNARTKWRWFDTATALTTAPTLLAGLILLAAPAASAQPPSARVGSSAAGDSAGDHSAGSQIRRHEPAGSGTRSPLPAAASVPGMDVSAHQGEVDWAGARADGARFAYVKASEGTGYTSPTFTSQYEGAAAAGLLRGAYHFALPDQSSGAVQATHFVANGGGWSADGRTLPGTLDIEYNPYGDACYGQSADELASWIRDFTGTYRAATGRAPVIYTSTRWWERCVSGAGDFGSSSPLWIARYDDQVGPLPSGWSNHTIWQHATSGTFPGDQNLFNGDYASLETFARG